MCVLTTSSAILALFTLVGAAPVCEELVKPLNLEDLTPITGKWWFLSGYSDSQLYRDILKVLNSSWITLTSSGQPDSLVMSQGNKINGKCEFSISNITSKDGHLHVTQMFEDILVISDITILPSGPGYLTMQMNDKMANVTIRSLYIFGRSAKLSETEQQAFQRQAECLNIHTSAPYTYDGVTELCDQAQHNIICEPLLKPQEVKDPAQLMGKWVFLAGYVDYTMFIDILKTATSSWIALTPASQKDSITMTQGNRLNGKCVFSNSNGSISDSVLYMPEVHDGQLLTTKGRFLSSGGDTLILHLNSIMEGKKIRSLYMFGRSGQAPTTDMETFQKQAECLGWIRQAHYTYDGVTELCEESSASP